MAFEMVDPSSYRTIEFLQDIILQLKHGHLSCTKLHKETIASPTEKIRNPQGGVRPLITDVDISIQFRVPFRPRSHHS